MPTRKKGRGGARRNTGPKPKAGVARSERRTLLLTPDEARRQDDAAAAVERLWPDWIRRAADHEIERQIHRQAILASADEGLITPEERDALLGKEE